MGGYVPLSHAYARAQLQAAWVLWLPRAPRKGAVAHGNPHADARAGARAQQGRWVVASLWWCAPWAAAPPLAPPRAARRARPWRWRRCSRAPGDGGGACAQCGLAVHVCMCTQPAWALHWVSCAHAVLEGQGCVGAHAPSCRLRLAALLAEESERVGLLWSDMVGGQGMKEEERQRVGLGEGRAPCGRCRHWQTGPGS